jgi:hypothetical protein
MIVINIDKAKGIAHEMRRAKRAKEFAPYDEVIMKQIPGNDAVEAEAARQAIRDKYAQIQLDIDSAPGVNEVKFVIEGM